MTTTLYSRDDVIAELRAAHGDAVPKLELLRAGITQREYARALLDSYREVGRLEAERCWFETMVKFHSS